MQHITTGAGNDIERATELARKMVCEWGMSELGPLSFGKKEEQIFLGREIAQHRDYSEETAIRIDEQVQEAGAGWLRPAPQVIIERTSDALVRIAESAARTRGSGRRGSAPVDRRRNCCRRATASRRPDPAGQAAAGDPARRRPPRSWLAGRGATAAGVIPPVSRLLVRRRRHAARFRGRHLRGDH